MASSNSQSDVGGNTGDGPPTPPYYAAAIRALELMEPNWQCIGNRKPTTTSSTTASSTATIWIIGDDEEISSMSQSDIVDDIVSLLLVRLVAIVAPLGTYPDLSIQSICQNVVRKNNKDYYWPPLEISDTVIAELKEFVYRIIKRYKDVPYHNQEHAHHVVLSTCKLLDMVLYVDNKNIAANKANTNKASQQGQQPTAPPAPAAVSYGLRNDPMLLFVSVFAALIHDVEHQGLANRQLALEKDRLAVLYNDQSIAENWSLYVAFSEFLQDDFANLRNALFGSNLDPGTTSDQVYLQFRKSVINLVLSTDIASPERTQIGKSKWKEAFGDPYETVERKMRAEQAGFRRRSLLTGREFNVPNNIQPSSRMNRRGTQSTGHYSELTAGDGGGDGIGEEGLGIGEGKDSLSGTPEGSVTKDCSMNEGDDEDDDNAMKDIGDGVSPLPAPKGSCMETGSMERASYASPGGMVAAASAHGGASGLPSKWERRMSTTSRNTTASQRYRQRLGILRTVDLSGETIENYSASSRGGGLSGAASVISSDHAYQVELEADEPDTLRSEVLMECIMTAADVAHNLQGWEQMAKWSNRLYLELRKAHVANRGMDASPKWFENQIGFLESYLLPLAHRLEDSGVFPDIEFAKIVEDNRDRWMVEGFDVAQNIIKRGAEVYPENGN